ncbi:formylglycine-generating enzyme family protein [Photorhabdus thracensis]|uniref:formylglycine-generating enzyme family protein n=1 Tax=Photorhabdus thracensis TaxID=230089 RepID=UPI001E408321|nr:SUMF1/EgtB/PvdO family nonheme iron enzyme [Photorhabdus thracensis]MCC8419732.1 SUMF1/EgtB/PvdO family nonheme iron enzyme [Photorhabdus thracensis]
MMKSILCYPLVVGLVLLTLAGCKDTNKVQAEQQSLVKEVLAEMVPVEGGSFMMGDFGRRVAEHLPYSLDMDNKPEHKVTLDSFKIAKYKVTWGQFNRYRAILGLPKTASYNDLKSSDPDYEYLNRSTGDNYPASVYWQEAKDYCQWLGKMSGKKVDLPTEAQWEYAARSRGQLFIFASNNNEYGYKENFASRISPVGSYPPNPLGLYDMMGNGTDWVNDWYSADYYQHSPEHNPQGPEHGNKKVMRGMSGGDGVFSTTITRDKDWFENGKLVPLGYGFRCVVNYSETKNPTLDLKDSHDGEKPTVNPLNKQGVAKS